jgi:hypothetical protein
MTAGKGETVMLFTVFINSFVALHHGPDPVTVLDDLDALFSNIDLSY